MIDQGWKVCKPYGDSRKLPENLEALWKLFIQRVAYFVFLFQIPKGV